MRRAVISIVSVSGLVAFTLYLHVSRQSLPDHRPKPRTDDLP
jgi:hypothetical protein